MLYYIIYINIIYMELSRLNFKSMGNTSPKPVSTGSICHMRMIDAHLLLGACHCENSNVRWFWTYCSNIGDGLQSALRH